MRRTGGALALLFVLGGCAQSIDDIPVPEDFRQVIRDISGGARPGFTGSTCFSKPLDRQESHRYKAEFTAASPVDVFRGAGIERGWQPYRTKNGQDLLIREHNRETVVVGYTANGQNTRVSALAESNCEGEGQTGEPLFRARLDADPDLEPSQKRRLEGAYKAVRDAAVAIAPLLDPGHVDPRGIPWPPPIPDDYPGTDLQGCALDERGAQGAKWASRGVVAGYITDTTDVQVGEQRVGKVLGGQWRIVERIEGTEAATVFERTADGVPGRLSLKIRQGHDQRDKPGLDLDGELSTGCVPPTAR